MNPDLSQECMHHNRDDWFERLYLYHSDLDIYAQAALYYISCGHFPYYCVSSRRHRLAYLRYRFDNRLGCGALWCFELNLISRFRYSSVSL